MPPRDISLSYRYKLPGTWYLVCITGVSRYIMNPEGPTCTISGYHDNLILLSFVPDISCMSPACLTPSRSSMHSYYHIYFYAISQMSNIHYVRIPSYPHILPVNLTGIS